MITYADEQQQRSPEWYRARLGNITGSRCGELMVKGRSREDIFGATARAYLYQLAAERDMNPQVLADEDLFSQYLEAVDVTSRAMRWGTDNEADARKLFEEIYGCSVSEVASCRHDTIAHFAASPDGVVIRDMRPVACVEIKCPGQKAFMQYSVEVTDGASLKKANSTYYWQTQAEMMCTGTELTYFCVYNPFQNRPLHVAEIARDEADCTQLAERIAAADRVIDDMVAIQ